MTFIYFLGPLYVSNKGKIQIHDRAWIKHKHAYKSEMQILQVS